MIEVYAYDGIDWRLEGEFTLWTEAAAQAERLQRRGWRVKIEARPL